MFNYVIMVGSGAITYLLAQKGTDIKKLQGHNMYRMKVGNIRILYTVDDVIKIISVEEIDSRGDIYKRL